MQFQKQNRVPWWILWIDDITIIPSRAHLRKFIRTISGIRLGAMQLVRTYKVQSVVAPNPPSGRSKIHDSSQTRESRSWLYVGEKDELSEDQTSQREQQGFVLSTRESHFVVVSSRTPPPPLNFHNPHLWDRTTSANDMFRLPLQVDSTRRCTPAEKCGTKVYLPREFLPEAVRNSQDLCSPSFQIGKGMRIVRFSPIASPSTAVGCGQPRNETDRNRVFRGEHGKILKRPKSASCPLETLSYKTNDQREPTSYDF